MSTTPSEIKPSGFDSYNPPEKNLIDSCVHCGFCLPACPTYVLWGEEMDSPRGRIYMMNKVATGDSPLNQRFQQHIDNCLGCMSCVTACPSGVQYNKLIEDTRGQVERNIPRSLDDSLFRKLLFATFPHTFRLRLLALAMLVYQRTGVQFLVRKLGLMSLLPKRLAAMEALLPPVPLNPFRRLPSQVAPNQPAKRRIGLLAGCVQQVFFQHVNEATIRVLAAEGFEVIVPPSQGCCGALMLHSGVEEEAAKLAKKMIACFEAEGVDTIVINAAGCGSTMKEYGHLLRSDPAWAARAAAFSAKCKDISEVLTEMPLRTKRHPLPMRIAYHDACHLRHAQGIFEQPRKLLNSIPGVEVVEIEEATLCCGSAGVYNLLNPEPANVLGDRKVGHLLETHADAVVSANPGCLLQLGYGLRRRNEEAIPAFHLVQLLDASMRNEQLIPRAAQGGQAIDHAQHQSP
jgi:glycolate oxidase iron-sulfur subunit